MSRYHALFVFDHFLATVAELANVLWLSSRTIPGFYGRNGGNIKDEWIEVFATCYFFVYWYGHGVCSCPLWYHTCKVMVFANGTVKLPK